MPLKMEKVIKAREYGINMADQLARTDLFPLTKSSIERASTLPIQQKKVFAGVQNVSYKRVMSGDAKTFREGINKFGYNMLVPAARFFLREDFSKKEIEIAHRHFMKRLEELIDFDLFDKT